MTLPSSDNPSHKASEAVNKVTLRRACNSDNNRKRTDWTIVLTRTHGAYVYTYFVYKYYLDFSYTHVLSLSLLIRECSNAREKRKKEKKKGGLRDI